MAASTLTGVFVKLPAGTLSDILGRRRLLLAAVVFATLPFTYQVDADDTRSRFPVAVVSDFKVAGVDLTVRFKPVSGRVDQAAGLVWRYQNEDNYHIVRANALENNVVLNEVENGKRTDLPLKNHLWFRPGGP